MRVYFFAYLLMIVLLIGCGNREYQRNEAWNPVAYIEAIGKIIGFDSNDNLNGLVCQLEAHKQSGVNFKVYLDKQANEPGAEIFHTGKATTFGALNDPIFSDRCGSIRTVYSFQIPRAVFNGKENSKVYIYIESIQNPGQLILIDSSGVFTIPLPTTSSTSSTTTSSSTTSSTTTSSSTTSSSTTSSSTTSSSTTSSTTTSSSTTSSSTTSSTTTSSSTTSSTTTTSTTVPQLFNPPTPAIQPVALEPGKLSGRTIGYFEGFKNGVAMGWACQVNVRNSLKIKVYASGNTSHPKETFIGEYNANLDNGVGVDNACSTAAVEFQGAHRFQIPVAAFAAHPGKDVFIYGITKELRAGGETQAEVLLNRLAPASRVPGIPGPDHGLVLEPGKLSGQTKGNFEGFTNGIALGWACQTDVRNSLKVRAYVSGRSSNPRETLIGEYNANLANGVGVDNACSTAAIKFQGAHRFQIPVAAFAAHPGKEVYIYAISKELRTGGETEWEVPLHRIPMRNEVPGIPGPDHGLALEPGKLSGQTKGHFEGFNGGIATGWACQMNVRNSLKIKVYVSTNAATPKQTLIGEFIANSPTGEPVNNACSSAAVAFQGARRFRIPVSSFAGHKNKIISVFAIAKELRAGGETVVETRVSPLAPPIRVP